MYNKLVLSGGGKRGLMLLGSLEYIFQEKKTEVSSIDTYIGTSIGSIICYLLIIGYQPKEIIAYLISNNFFQQFKNIDFISLGNCEGGFDWNILQNYLFDLTSKKHTSHTLTLSELNKTFHKTLTCVTYNYTKQQIEYISHLTHPNLSCVDALHMTSNIPFYFNKFKYGDSEYIDGCIINNFPINLLSENDHALALNVTKMYLNTDKSTFTSYLLNLCTIVIINNVKNNIDNCVCKHLDTISLEGKNISSTDLYVNVNDVFKLFSSGYTTTKDFFNK
jgi:predicted acylesterase/phospholipase RssA